MSDIPFNDTTELAQHYGGMIDALIAERDKFWAALCTAEAALDLALFELSRENAEERISVARAFVRKGREQARATLGKSDGQP